MPVLLLVALLFSMAQPLRAAAQDTPTSSVAEAGARARTHFNAGTVFYEGGDFEDALREFQAAYDLSSRPELLWNIALCHEHLGHLEEAADALRRFGASGAPGHTVEAVEEALTALNRRIEERGEPAREPIAPSTPSTAPRTPPPVDTTPYVGIAGFSVAALGVVGFAIFGALTVVEDGALTAECGTTCTAERASSLDTYALVADISAGLALAGAIVGVIGLVITPSAPPSEATVSVTPWVRGDGAGLIVGGAL